VLVDLARDELQLPDQGFDVCICGAGPAGITLALRLSQRGFKVALLEGGGLEYTEESQVLYDAEMRGLPAYPRLNRLRFFGGTSNHWAGRCKPYHTLDFARESIAGLPGWPITKAEIDPYLQDAMEILDLPPGSPFKSGAEPQLDADQFVPDSYAVSAPTRFGTKYLEQIKAAQHLVCVVNANVTEIRLRHDLRTSDSVTVVTFGGRKATFSAKFFVFALGGMENARMLLASNSQLPAGIGNSGDFVGRCFMEHFNVRIGAFAIGAEFSELASDSGSRLEYFTSPAFVRQNDIGSSNFTMSVVKGYKAWGRTARLKETLQELACEWGLDDQLKMVLTFQCAGEGTITSLCEQSPNRDSRVMLSKERDALGVRKAIVDWRMNDYDRRSIRLAGIALAEQVALKGLGRIQLEEFMYNDKIEIATVHHSHHMGTTRMARSADSGVVDTDCRVFGVDNLYVAGSSIFATGGGNNPTMPIIQFALRLVDKISDRLRTGGAV